MKRLYEMLVRALTLLPYGFSFSKEQWVNVRSAKNTITLLDDLGITPATLVDVGANRGQWAVWLKRHYPTMRVIAFEPHPKFTPCCADALYRIALTSGKRRTLTMTTEAGASHISSQGDIDVTAARFDELEVKLSYPAILKVDAENFTADALRSFGNRLAEFDVIVVEMWNYYPTLSQFKYQQDEIWKLVLSAGKTRCRVIDCEWTAGDGIPVYDVAFSK